MPIYIEFLQLVTRGAVLLKESRRENIYFPFLTKEKGEKRFVDHVWSGWQRLFSEAIKNRLWAIEWMILNQSLTI